MTELLNHHEVVIPHPSDSSDFICINYVSRLHYILPDLNYLSLSVSQQVGYDRIIKTLKRKKLYT
jgi:hypothetical protein